MKSYGRPWIKGLIGSVGVAAVLSAFNAQALVLGHSRVISPIDAPLRITVHLKDLGPDELHSLQALIAPAHAWQEAGLKPPVDLNSMRVELEPATQSNAALLLIRSTQPSSESVLDVLLDIKTGASAQRHQVSLLQNPTAQKPVLASEYYGAQTTTPTAAATSTRTASTRATDDATPAVASTKTATTIPVRQGQTLYGLTRQHNTTSYTDQQFMLALLQANPHAFSHQNINLLRAGAELVIPDAQAIAAIPAAQARQLYQQQIEWFDEYRQRLAQGQAPVVTSATPADHSSVAPLAAPPEKAAPHSNPVNETSTESTPAADRLQLAAADPEVAKADQQVATSKALAHTAERLAELDAPASAAATTASVSTADASVPAETKQRSDSNSTELTASLDATTGSALTDSASALAQAPDVEVHAESVTSERVADATAVASSPSHVSAAATADESQTKSPPPTTSDSHTGWLKESNWWWGLVIVLAVVVFITRLLRRGQLPKTDYAEVVSTRPQPRARETATDEVEFREIRR